MKIDKNCRWVLAGAVGTLLGTQSQASDSGWQAESGVRYYSEDGRVTSVEPVLQLSNTNEQERTISINIAYDSLSKPLPLRREAQAAVTAALVMEMMTMMMMTTITKEEP